MATNTTPRGYRYPDGNETPALDILFGHLAQDVNADTTILAAAVALIPTARFKGSILGANVAVPVGAMAFTSFDDPAAKWSVANKNWTAPVAGTYLLIGAIKNNATPVAAIIRFTKNGSQVASSPNFSSSAYGGGQLTAWVRCAVGDTLGMYSGAAYTTQSDAPVDSNFFEIVQVQA